MALITKTDLENAKLDADTIAAVANNASGTVTSRTGRVLKVLGQLTAEMISSLAGAAADVVGGLPVIVLGKNRFDKDSITPSYFVGVGGVLIANETYDASDFIPVPPNTQICVRHARTLAEYDRTKTYVADSLFDNGSYPVSYVWTTGPTTRYIRVCQGKDRTPTQQVEYGSGFSSFEAYRATLKHPAGGPVTADYVNTPPNTVALKTDLLSIELQTNRFDASTITAGKYIETDGSLSSNVNYDTSDFIPVTGATQVSARYARTAAEYDANKDFIGGTFYEGTSVYPGGRAWTTNAAARFIRVCHGPEKNSTQQVEYGAGFTSYQPYQPVVKSPTGAPLSINSVLGTQTPIVLPPNVYFTEGREGSIYLDNIIPSSSFKDFEWSIVGPTGRGKQQNERFTWVPSGSASAANLTVNLIDRRTGLVLASATTKIQAAALAAKTGQTPKCLFIGDSLTNAGVYTQELLNIASGDGMGIALYGTRGSGSNRHEGRGGWSIQTYATDYSDGPYGANPFWIDGQVNFPAYLVNSSIPEPDWAFIHLGVNDAFGRTTDAQVRTAAATAFGYLDTLIASIKAAGGTVKVGLMIPIPPSADQDSFGADYGIDYQRWRVKRNAVLWAEQLIAKYANRTADRIYIVSSNVSIDTSNNMPRAAAGDVNSRSTVQVARQSNSVHPAVEGHYQLADAVWAFLKCN